jgi:sialic acid synthase SpsE
MSAHSYGNPTFRIADREIGGDAPTFVIAEVGSNHNRDLATAHHLIEVAAEAGADAVKFQTFTAEGLYSRHTPTMTYLKDGLLAASGSVWELIKQNELPWDWHAELAEAAHAAGLLFLSTPFEAAAVDALEEVHVPAYKIASYEITHLPLVRRCAETGKPLLISTGMASLGDIEQALDAAVEAGARDIAVMHCAINYPPAFEDLNLRAIPTLSAAFAIPVGWSDHTPGHTADVVAVELGARIIEKHFTLSRSQKGPDHPFAVEPKELAAMVTAIRETEAALGSSVKRMTAAETEMYRLGRRSLVAAHDLPADHEMSSEDVLVKRPGYGIPVDQLSALMGRRTTQAHGEDEILTWEEL